MSFYDIKDHKKRDEIIRNYLATMKRIKKHNMDERLENLGYQIQMQEKFKPVLESNAETRKEITQDLVPIKQELENLNKNTIQYRDRLNKIQVGTPRRILPTTPVTPSSSSRPTIPSILQDLTETPVPPKSKRKKPVHYGPVATKYLMNALNVGNDTVTGIRYDGSTDMMIGDKKVEIQDNNLKIGNEIYNGTPGLWALITERKPKVYTPEDLDAYRNLMVQTSALYKDNDPATERSRGNRSYKWKRIQKPIWEEQNKKKNGEGIVFLPKDIKGLWQKLKLLGAEYRAGNKTTRNELVAVLDELKRQGGITEEEYTNINSSI